MSDLPPDTGVSSRVCGTISAYRGHRDRGEDPCDACIEANRTYSREYSRKYRNKQGADLRAKENRYHKARARALTRLAAEYPIEFHEFLAEELANED